MARLGPDLRRAALVLALCLLGLGLMSGPAPAAQSQFFFSTGTTDGKMAMASRPASTGKIEIEAADDLVLTDQTRLTSASFTGLLPTGAPLSSIQQVVVEIYRVFPNDSDTGRTSGPPLFSTTQVPTRVNSPSDVAFASRDVTLTTVATVTNPSFTALNSVLNGINKSPNQKTGGEGAVSGEEVQFGVNFNTPLDLPADHYFFVPQVTLSSGDFFWLSAPKPIMAPGTPFTPDLQAWIRNDNLDPDWLRVGTDIVGGTTPPTFNASFTLSGIAGCPAISLSPATLPDATAGTPYSSRFSASGSDIPFSFSETGALPSGFKFAPDGTLSGTSGQTGSFPLTVTATDGRGCSGSENVALRVVAASPRAPGATKATISGLAESNSVFVVGKGSTPLVAQTARRRPRGTTFSFRLDQAATVTVAIERKGRGRRAGRACKPDSRRLRRKPRCVRFSTVTTLTRIAHAGLNRIAFSGRIRGRALKPASYRAVFTARDAAGASKALSLSFKIVTR